MITTYDKFNRIWSGSTEELIYNSKNSLGQIVFHQLANFANKVIQIDDTTKTSLTGQQALTWGIRIAQHLKKMQLSHNDVIGISAPNTTYVLPLALGCFFNCTPVHAVHPSLDEDSIAHCYGLTKPKIIFCSGQDFEKIKNATELFRPLIYTSTEHIAKVPKIVDLLEVTESENCYRPEKLTLESGKQTVAILCSSGTTGKPKAVCLSTPLLLTSDVFNTSDSIIYVANSIDWATGMYFFINSCLRGYTRIIHSGHFDVDYFLDLIAKYKINSTFLSSPYVAALVQHPRTTRETLSSLRTIITGGCNLSLVNTRRLTALCHNLIKPWNSYGSTEMYFTAAGDITAKPMSVGKLSPGFKLIIVDEHGQRLANNQVGEILLGNPNPWIGYYGNRCESEKAVDSGDWFHTGDMGYMDEDNDLFIVDRKKEILRYRGFHFWPREIEEVIMELPGIQDVCVVSIFDDVRVDLAGALVVKNLKAAVTPQSIMDHVNSRLKAIHKQLHAGVYFVDELPKNHNGKTVKKFAKEVLQRLVDENHSNTAHNLESKNVEIALNKQFTET